MEASRVGGVPELITHGEDGFLEDVGDIQAQAARVLELLGDDAPQRTGCRIATGYMGLTLFWMQSKGMVPAKGIACFATDYFAALLTGNPSCLYLG